MNVIDFLNEYLFPIREEMPGREDILPEALFVFPTCSRRRGGSVNKVSIEDSKGRFLGAAAATSRSRGWRGELTDWAIVGCLAHHRFEVVRDPESEGRSMVVLESRVIARIGGWPRRDRGFRFSIEEPEGEAVSIWSCAKWLHTTNSFRISDSGGPGLTLAMENRECRNRLFPEEFCWGGRVPVLALVLLVKMLACPLIFNDFE